MPDRISTTLYTDPGCPWAYSAIPMLRVLEWRYGDQLDWRLVVIGLTERHQQYVDRGYTPLMMAQGYARFRRYGMPFSTTPKRRVAATARACRAIVASRLADPGSDLAVFRALQFGYFTTPGVMDEAEDIAAALAPIGAEGLAARLD